MATCKNGSNVPFLRNVKSLVTVLRVITLVPVVVTRNDDGNFHAKVSRLGEILCFVSLIGIPTAAVYIITKLSNDLYSNFNYAFFLIGRIVVTALIHLLCLLKRQRISDSLNEASKLRVTVPTIWVSAPIGSLSLLIFFVVSSELVTDRPLVDALVMAWIDVLGVSTYAGMIFLYVFQVATIRAAGIELRTYISKYLPMKTSLEVPILRPVMLRHQTLRGVCSILNATYGSLLFLTFSGLYLEITFCLSATVIFGNLSISTRIGLITGSVLPSSIAIGAMLICQAAENEMSKIRTLMSNVTGTITSFRSLTSQIEIFEWNLQFKQLPISFHTNGFFDVNGAQITMMISLISTYVVIGMQNWIMLLGPVGK